MCLTKKCKRLILVCCYTSTYVLLRGEINLLANRLIVACIDTIDHPSIELVAIVLVPPLLCCDQVVLKAISLHHFWHPFSTNGEANNGEVHPFWIQFILSPLLLPLTTIPLIRSLYFLCCLSIEITSLKRGIESSLDFITV